MLCDIALYPGKARFTRASRSERLCALFYLFDTYHKCICLITTLSTHAHNTATSHTHHAKTSSMKPAAADGAVNTIVSAKNQAPEQPAMKKSKLSTAGLSTTTSHTHHAKTSSMKPAAADGAVNTIVSAKNQAPEQPAMKKSKLSTAGLSTTAGGSSNDPTDMPIKNEDVETDFSFEDSGEEETSYEVDRVKSRKWFEKEKVFKYLVQWKGDFKDTYEPITHLSGAACEFAYHLSPFLIHLVEKYNHFFSSDMTHS